MPDCNDAQKRMLVSNGLTVQGIHREGTFLCNATKRCNVKRRGLVL